VITGRHRGVVEAAVLERGLLERAHLGGAGRLGGADLVPGLIEQRRSEVLGSGIALVELLRRQHLLEELGRHRLAALVVAGVMRDHARLARPHLVVLRGVLDEVARHRRAASFA